MRKWLFILPALLAVLSSSVLIWRVALPSDALFHGKPESEWIKSISYYGDEAQLKRWRGLGPDGLRLLARTLDKGRSYRKAYRSIMPRLPALLRQFGKEAKPVEPAIARALSDDDPGVRQIAVGCYEELLVVMTEREKTERLPEFIKAMHDREWGIRNNAAVALRLYSEQAPVVVPVLTKALQDPAIQVRLMAAEALARVDVTAATRAGTVPILIEIMRNPNDQVANRAAYLLGRMGQEPNLAVPALIEAMHGTNALVATSAAQALGKFPGRADLIIPVLVTALEETNGIVSRWALTTALREIDPTNVPKQELKQTQ